MSSRLSRTARLLLSSLCPSRKTPPARRPALGCESLEVREVPAVVPLTQLAYVGDAAPGAGGATYTTFGNPVVNDAGQVSFTANLSGGTTGLFVTSSGSVAPVALGGATAPGAAGATYGTFLAGSPILNDAGQVAFGSSLTGAVVGPGLFVGTADAVSALAIKGDVAPGTGGAVYSTFTTTPVFSAGAAAFTATLTGTTASSGVFVGTPGSVAPVALRGAVAPGAAAATYNTFTPSLAVNAAGRVAFGASLTGGISAAGVFTGVPGAVTAVALQGTLAPGAGGATYGAFFASGPAINDAGQVAFGASLTGTTVGQGVFLASPGAEVSPVALRGMTAPGTDGAVFNTFTNYVLNAAGQVVFTATLTGGTVASGIFIGTPGSLALVALQGAPAPGIEGGTFPSLSSNIPVLNGAGQVAFTAAVTVGGVPGVALYAGTPGNLQLLARKGDMVDVDPSPEITNLKTVNTIILAAGSGGQDGKAGGFNEAGQLAFKLVFVDNSQGVFSPGASVAVPDGEWAEGSPVALTGVASELGVAGPDAAYTWTVFKGYSAPFATGTGADWSFTPDDDGTYRVVLTATGGAGGVSTAERTVVVTNAAPSPSITSVGDVRVAGTNLALSGTATDPAGTNDTLTYTWAVYKDGSSTAFAAGAGADWGFTPDAVGSYRVVLTAADEDGGSGSAEQTITVGGAAFTLTGPTAPSVAENTTAVGTFTTPGSGTAPTYTLSGADAALFTISPAGVLSFRAAPDYEAGARTFAVTVTATGAPGESAAVDVNVTVLNANDNAPVVTSPGTVTADENTIAVLAVTATDADGTTPTYAITGGADADLFTIDAATGALSFRAAPDFEAPGSAAGDNAYAVVVGAADGVAVTTRVVTVTVTNVNDTAPVAAADGYTLAEDAAGVALDVLGNDADADNSSAPLNAGLTVTAVGTALNGTAAVVNGVLTYAPNPGFFGTDTFEYTVSDGVATGVGTVTVTVTPVADTPTVTGVATVAEDGQLAGLTVVRNAADGAEVTHVRVTGVTGGTLVTAGGTPVADGAFLPAAAFAGLVFTPTPDFSGTAGFTVQASTADTTAGLGGSPVPVTITVTPVNDAPTRTAGVVANLQVGEDAPAAALGLAGLAYTAGPADEADQTLTYTVTAVPAPALGTVVLADGTTVVTAGGIYTLNQLRGVQFRAAPDASGAGAFAFTATDDGRTAGAADPKAVSESLTITVLPVNDAPVAADASATTDEDTPLVGSVGGTDADGDALTASVVAGASHGSLTLNPDGTYLYTPAADFHGTDGFTFRLADATAAGNVATVTITVAPVNDAPAVAAPVGTVAVAEDAAPATVALSGVFGDVDGTGGLTFTVDGTSNPDLVAASVAGGSLTLTFTPDRSGTATVVVRATDAAGASVADTVTVTVAAVNDAPVQTANAGLTVAEGGSAVLTPAALSATDADTPAAALVYTVTTAPTRGTLTLGGTPLGAGGTFTQLDVAQGRVAYTHDGAEGTGDAFTFTVSDGAATLPAAMFAIAVTPVNDAPTAADATTTTAEDTAVAGAVAATDADGDPLTYAVVAGPTRGALTAFDPATGAFTYLPGADFHGTDTFVVSAGDGRGGVATATVTLTVTPVNDAPVAAGAAYTTAEDTPLVVGAPGVLGGATDADGDPLSAVLVSGPDHGTLLLNADGSFAYAPAADYTGPDSFTYALSDGNGGTAVGTVSLTVSPVNDAPAATADTLTVAEDSGATVVGVLTNDTAAPDAGETLAVTAVGPAAHGTVTLLGGVVTYTPAADYFGTDSFSYTLSDGNGGTATGTVNTTVTPTDDAPVSLPDALTVAEDAGATVVDVLANDTTAPDVGEALTVVSVTQPAHGTATLVGGVVRYTPAADYHGPDSFTYTVSDGTGTSTSSVALTVTPVNDPPAAAADAFTADGRPGVADLPVLANDTTPDAGQVLRVVAVTQPAGGEVAVSADGRSVRFTAAPGFVGTTTFTYTVADGTGLTATADVTVTVAPPRLLGPVRPVEVGGAADGSVRAVRADGTATVVSPFGSAVAATRTATGDVDGDGTADLVAVTGPGTPLRVAVVSGADGSVLVAPFDPFGGNFSGGGTVAAGDLDGDGKAEFVVTPDQGGGPRVAVFGVTAGAATVRANFFGIDDADFRGGARAALGDVNADGVPDVVVTAGFGGGPRTAIFTGQSVLAGAPARLVGDFFAFPGRDATTLRNGSFVAAGDVTGDGYADLVFGGGPGGAPRVFILSGALVSAGRVDAAQASPVANFFVGGDLSDRGGVRVAVTNADGDGKADVAVGSGAGRPARVPLYLGKDFAGAGEPPAADLDVLGGAVLADGVYVG